jgi:ABC-2 type transport system ATP-binding protein
VVEAGGPGADAAARAVLAGALGLGVVDEFSPLRPSLADLFRGVVSADDVGSGGPGGPGGSGGSGAAPPETRRPRGRREVAA